MSFLLLHLLQVGLDRVEPSLVLSCQTRAFFQPAQDIATFLDH
jgi:hypothetical protein